MVRTRRTTTTSPPPNVDVLISQSISNVATDGSSLPTTSHTLINSDNSQVVTTAGGQTNDEYGLFETIYGTEEVPYVETTLAVDCQPFLSHVQELIHTELLPLRKSAAIIDRTIRRIMPQIENALHDLLGAHNIALTQSDTVTINKAPTSSVMPTLQPQRSNDSSASKRGRYTCLDERIENTEANWLLAPDGVFVSRQPVTGAEELPSISTRYVQLVQNGEVIQEDQIRLPNLYDWSADDLRTAPPPLLYDWYGDDNVRMLKQCPTEPIDEANIFCYECAHCQSALARTTCRCMSAPHNQHLPLTRRQHQADCRRAMNGHALAIKVTQTAHGQLMLCSFTGDHCNSCHGITRLAAAVSYIHRKIPLVSARRTIRLSDAKEAVLHDDLDVVARNFGVDATRLGNTVDTQLNMRLHWERGVARGPLSARTVQANSSLIEERSYLVPVVDKGAQSSPNSRRRPRTFRLITAPSASQASPMVLSSTNTAPPAPRSNVFVLRTTANGEKQLVPAASMSLERGEAIAQWDDDEQT